MIPAKPLNLFDLPYELLEHIFLFMPFHVLLYFSHTCRKLRDIIRHLPTFLINLKHLEIIYQNRILHCANNLDFLEYFPKTVIDEGFDHTISPGIKERFSQIKELNEDSLSIFIIPPSFDELKNRLVLRGSESDDAIERRLVNAKKELESAELFDYIVLNDNFNETIKKLSSIIFNINHEYNKQDNLNILRDLLDK